MKVTAIEKKVENSEVFVTAKIKDKNDLELKFVGIEDIPFANDCIFLNLYIQAMQDGTNLEFPVDSPVSKPLSKNIQKHHDIFSQWFKNQLKPISFFAEETNSATIGAGAVSLFSGGIDSCFTYVKNKPELTHLFLCIGLDIQLEDDEKIDFTIEQYSDLAKQHNKSLIVVYTNMRHVFPDGNRALQHAAIFAGLTIACGLKTLYIPASHNIDELFPWGSHLLTDHLLSNGVTEVIHHGATSRTEKTRVISEDKDTINKIRICNTSDQFNCGECEKCLRTMFALAVLNKTSSALPLLAEKEHLLSKLKIYKENQYTFWQDNYKFALEHNRNDLAKLAKRIVKSYKWRNWIKQGLSLMKEK